ncbi:MAG: hypothetical protein HDQ99_02550 [Lachnospiraceae bacterium]|nr:hypothetical protein [Lachnospiraceae bacterium]
MDFKAYAKQKRLEAHKEIITEICLLINNCANCHNDETGKTDCFPLNCVDLHKVTADSFYMETFDDSRTNRKLLDIASQCGYEAGFVMEGKEISIKFWKKK